MNRGKSEQTQLTVCIFIKNGLSLQSQKNNYMEFDLITDNEHLWAVKYNDCPDNVLDTLLDQWNDVSWLRSFFKQNIDDLA